MGYPSQWIRLPWVRINFTRGEATYTLHSTWFWYSTGALPWPFLVIAWRHTQWLHGSLWGILRWHSHKSWIFRLIKTKKLKSLLVLKKKKKHNDWVILSKIRVNGWVYLLISCINLAGPRCQDISSDIILFFSFFPGVCFGMRVTFK